jgi:hypothetical protein
MSHELICNWLGLPSGAWPPDHYQLLGLAPGESDADLIEQRVHQRLDAVRRYQMMHPEQATEAMNRLAQAFVCLTEPASKRVYDATLLGVAPAPQPVEVAESEPPAALECLYKPTVTNDTPFPTGKLPPNILPPPPLPAAALPPPLPEPVAQVVVPAVPPAPELPPSPLGVVLPPLPPAPPVEQVDPAVEAARSAPARKGISTKRGLYHRIARTRELVRVWDQVGKYLASPRRRLNRATEAADLLHRLHELQNLLVDFPPLLGEAGQPGYLVLALSELVIVPTFQTLSLSQRDALSRDWRAGLKLLQAHRDFLRQEIRAMRRRTFSQRLVRAVRAFLNEQPGAAMLLVLALVALNVALWRTYASAWWHHLRSAPAPTENKAPVNP